MIDRRNLVLGGASLAALSAASSLRAEEEAETNAGAWTARADMPFPVQEIYPIAITLGRKPALMNAGGIAAGLSYPIKRATTLYDPVADAWRKGTPLPYRRHHIALAGLAGHVYAIGGFRREGVGFWNMRADVARIADPENGEWEAVTPLPAPQAEAVCVSVDNRIHIIGGRRITGERNKDWDDHVDTDAHWAFDPSINMWEQCAPLPTARNSAAIAEIKGELYVVSGRTVTDGNTPACEVYNPGDDTWRTIAPLPAPVRQQAPRGQGGLAAAARNGKLYCFGGEWFGDTPGVYADAWEYNPQTDSWRAVAAMPRPRHGLGAANLPDGIYVIGGATGPSGDGVSPYLDRFEI